MRASTRIIKTIQGWSRPTGWKAFRIWFGLIALLAATTVFIYFLGGTRLSTPHLYYVVVLLGAFFFRYSGGISMALAAGLLAGPFMPLDVATGQMQPTGNWLLRAGGFLLAGSVGALIVHFHDVQIRALKDYFYSDWITDLPNRFRLEEIFQSLVAKESSAAAIVLEARAFTTLANSLGLAYGEQMIITLAARIKKSLPEDWTVIRLYSDRFAILAPGLSGLEATQWIRERYADLTKNYTIRKLPVYADFHFGVAEWPKQGEALFDLILKASLALEGTSDVGRYLALYSSEDDQRTRKNFQLAAEFEHAVQHNHLVPYFQPRVRLKDQTLSGFEALIRWEHPARGLLAPGQFMPVLEKTMLMRRLTEHVLRRSLACWKSWERAGQSLRIAVNISGRDLLNLDIYAVLNELIEQYEVPPGTLELEITESEMILVTEASLELVKRVTDLGIEIAVDDFGTGHSSHAYLKLFPAKTIKIDRLFVQNLPYDEKDKAIVGGILDLARRLDAGIIAEGVETEESLEYLRSVGCEEAQGFRIARPMSPVDTLEWMQAYEKMSP